MKVSITISCDVLPCGEDDAHNQIIDLRTYTGELREQIAYRIHEELANGGFSGDLPLALSLLGFETEFTTP